METVANKRYFGYDLLKALAIFMVVFYHMNMLDFAFDSEFVYFPNLNKSIQILAAAGVPLFFLVNGSLTLGKKLTSRKLIDKLGRLLYISVIWTVLLRIVVIGFLLKNEISLSINEFLNYYWFFYSLAVAYLVNFALGHLHKWCGYVVTIVLFSATFVNNFIWDLYLFVNPERSLPSWGHTGLFTLYGIVYTRIGAYLKDFQVRKLVCVIMMTIGYGLIYFETVVMTNVTGQLFDGVNAAFPTIGAMLLSCGIFCILKDAIFPNNKIGHLITLVGRNSGGVYIFHLTLIILIREYVFKNEWNIIFLPIVLVLMIAAVLTIVCALLSEKVRHSMFRSLLTF